MACRYIDSWRGTSVWTRYDCQDVSEITHPDSSVSLIKAGRDTVSTYRILILTPTSSFAAFEHEKTNCKFLTLSLNLLLPVGIKFINRFSDSLLSSSVVVPRFSRIYVTYSKPCLHHWLSRSNSPGEAVPAAAAAAGGAGGGWEALHQDPGHGSPAAFHWLLQRATGRQHCPHSLRSISQVWCK